MSKTESLNEQWKQRFINTAKFMLDTHIGTMYEYNMNRDGMWELVCTTNEWRCVRDVFPEVRYSSIYK